MSEIIPIGEKVLSDNDRLAAEIRARLARLNLPSLNLVSSPGSGKTSLLEKTLAHFGGRLRIALIAGDVQTDNDARRLAAAGGALVRPIVTGGACHLDARMVSRVLAEMELEGCGLLIIENVGNLVCPSSYDLGEDKKVVLLSTAEGDDKPLKYPAIFRRAALLVITKTDLLGLSDFDLERAARHARMINPEIEILHLSSRSGEGMADWYAWLERLTRRPAAAVPDAGGNPLE
ncbi:MAG TPA: hydrogenase nickel incorporation protein HypB [bacterium]|nr:hydrogenase nickel incorporation protein HypB [bacterium]HPM59027.1 hydrogenase nickel incorporation protein HypB [bacterium]